METFQHLMQQNGIFMFILIELVTIAFIIHVKHKLKGMIMHTVAYCNKH